MNKLKTIEIDPVQPPIASIIWLHGLGASGHDFVPIVRALALPNNLPIRFIFPEAPTKPVTINGGWIMPAWYDILSLTSNGPEDKTGILLASEQIAQLIENEIKAGIPSNAIYLAGFSQGGALALYTALHYPTQLGGLICLSSYLPLAEEFAQNLSEANRHLPIFISHGTSDDILSFSIGEMTQQFLKEAGHPITWKSYVMGHEVCGAEIIDIAHWLIQQLTVHK